MRVMVASLSNMLIRGMGGGAEGDFPLEPVDPICEEKIPLTQEQIDKLVEKIAPEIEALRHLVPEDMKK